MEIKKEEKYYRVVGDNKNALLYKAFSIPFQTLSTIINANHGIISPIWLIKGVYKNGGLFGFARGTAFNIVSFPVQLLFEFPLSILLDYTFYKNSPIKSLLSKTLFPFPSIYFSDVVTLAPFSMKFLEIIRKVVLGGADKLGSRISNNNEFLVETKNLLYSILSSIALLALRRLVLNLVNKIQGIFIEGRTNNPNSKLWKYTSLVYCNSIFQSLLCSFLVNPIEVIRLQYPYEFIQSYLKNSSGVLYAINPISMSIKVIKNQGWSKLFNGVPFLFPQFLLSNLSKNSNNNTHNHHYHHHNEDYNNIHSLN